MSPTRQNSPPMKDCRRSSLGARVGELARAQIPGGVLIDLPYYEFEGRIDATAKALADGAPAVYEASFLEEGVFVAVDILERRKNDFVLVEVKSTLDVKEEHLPDVAVQMHVVRRAGLTVTHDDLSPRPRSSGRRSGRAGCPSGSWPGGPGSRCLPCPGS